MTTDFRQLQRAARAFGLTYQQLLARYHADRGQDAPRSGAITWAQQEMKHVAKGELRTSFADSTLRRCWAPLNLRLEPEVHAALIARADLDREETPRIAPSHYLDAALRTGPRRRPAQLACMRDFLTTRGGSLAPGRPAVYSVSMDAHQVASLLRSPLAPAQLPSGEGYAVISALTARFLYRLGPQRCDADRTQPGVGG
ncbi:hypothetical protein ACIPJN_30105 [Streptomyces sp. NPDC086796]|uniref:hypothetical protein n=1 Tax=Streptomyces sp. NPDC086796 TaxID=3365760 RepID=UPI0037F6D05C